MRVKKNKNIKYIETKYVWQSSAAFYYVIPELLFCIHCKFSLCQQGFHKVEEFKHMLQIYAHQMTYTQGLSLIKQ